MVFILSTLWWIRTRSLWKLPDGRDWLRGKLGLVLMGRAMLSKWDGWMASLTQWTWVWVSYRSWSWTGRPGVLQSKGSQRVGHNWATELTELNWRTMAWSIIGWMLASLVAQTVKNMPALQVAWVSSLGGEEPLEKGLTNLSSILAWRILWTEEPSGLQVYGVTKSRTRLSD